MGIVAEIQTAVKALLPGITGHTQLTYEYDITLNSDRGYEKRFGFIPAVGDFVDGRALGSTTIDHTFQLILTDDFSNRDCDDAQNIALMGLYTAAQEVLKELQKSRLALPTPTNQVLLIRGLAFEDPEFSSDNSTVALRNNFNIQYRYRNN